MAYGDTEPVGTGIRSQPTTGSKRFPKGKAKPKAKESRTARYRRLSGDPRTRAAVPSQYLSSEHRREREMNARLNAPVGAGSSVTNRDVAREARADANVRYGQSEAELRNQYARSVMQQQRLPQYMDAYRAQLNQAKTQAQQAYAQAAQNARGLAGAVSNTAGDAQMVQQMQAEAAQRGGSVDPNALNTAVQAAAVRQAGGNSLGALADVQGANTGVMYDRDIATTGLRLIEELTREAGEQNRVNRSKVQLLGEKGEYEAGQRSKIRERERAAGLENLVFAADQQKAQLDASAKAQAADSEVNQWGYTAKEWRALSTSQRESIIKKQKGYGDKPPAPRETKYGYDADEWDGMSVSERRAAKKAWEAGEGGSGKVGKPGKEPGASLGPRRNLLDRSATIKSLAARQKLTTRGAFKAATRKSRKGWYSPGIEQLKTAAALDLAYGSRISRGTLAALRERGVYVTSTGEYWGGGNRNSG